MLYFKRQIETALEEAQDKQKDGRPTNEALLARYWFVRIAPNPKLNKPAYIASFEFACEVLGYKLEEERGRVLAIIDAKHGPHTQERHLRLLQLAEKPLPGDEEEIFSAPRVVAVRDQQMLFV